MATIADRVYLGAVALVHVDNLRAHHLDAALACARMSKAVYAIKDEHDPQGVRWIPCNDLRELFEDGANPVAAGASDLATYFTKRPEDDEAPGPEGLRAFAVSVPGGVALGARDGDTIIVAFRGTETESGDWGINFFDLHGTTPRMVDYGVDAHTRASLHAGFRYVALALNEAIKKPLADLSKETPRQRGTDRILYCGHSLGGALALLATQPKILALDRAQNFFFERHVLMDDEIVRVAREVSIGNQELYPQAIYTFGAPKSGDRNATRLLSNVHFRYVLEGDVVPGVPFADFSHDGPPIKFNPAKIFHGYGPTDRLNPLIRHDIGLYVNVVAQVGKLKPRDKSKAPKPTKPKSK